MTKKILIVLMLTLICVNVFSTVVATIVPKPNNYNENNLISNSIKSKGKNALATFVYIVNAATIATLVFMGLRYMLSSADVRADIKGSCITWTIGAVIVFAATNIVNIVLDIFI